jgi:hypothetical protein
MTRNHDVRGLLILTSTTYKEYTNSLQSQGSHLRSTLKGGELAFLMIFCLTRLKALSDTCSPFRGSYHEHKQTNCGGILY